MPDPNEQPPKRMTTAEAAALAQSVDGRLDDLSAVVTDLATRLQDIGPGGAATTPSQPAELVDAEGKPIVTRDQVDSRIHEALAPLHEEVHELRAKGTLTPETSGSLSGVLARLEEAERKLVNVEPGALAERTATELHPTLSDLRRRLSALEERPAASTSTAGVDANELTTLRNALHGLTRSLNEQNSEHVRALDDTHARLLRVEEVVTGNQDLPYDPPATQVVRRGGGAARKVLQLMQLVTSIEKGKEANLGKGGRFKFRGVDDAMDAVGHAMREVGLILSPKILDRDTTLTPVTQTGADADSGQKWERTVVWATTVLTVKYTFTDPDDGSTHSFTMAGEGRDSSDKSTSKAASMALKYGLFQGLMIPVTGLDDSDDAPPQQMVDQRAGDRPQQPSAPPSQPAEPQQTQQQPTEQQRAHRAGEALAALRKLHLVAPNEQYNRLVQIMNRVSSEGLLEFVVDGSTLDQHGKATMATLRQQSDQAKQGDPYDHRASTEPPDQDGSNYGETGGY